MAILQISLFQERCLLSGLELEWLASLFFRQCYSLKAIILGQGLITMDHDIFVAVSPTYNFYNLY